MNKSSDILNRLFELQDTEYKKFNSSLIPTVDPDIIIGVRTPQLRTLAKELKATALSKDFLLSLPHRYYEENNLHAFLICGIKDFDECIEELEKFLPYVDNWGTCDGIRPECFKKNCEKLLPRIDGWLMSDHTYTVRFGIEMLMTYFLDKYFDPAFLEKVSAVKSDEYYINMMIAWFFATALAKQYESAVVYIEQRRLPEWVHNKTVQKALESYRISDTQKEYLRTFRVKRRIINEASR